MVSFIVIAKEREKRDSYIQDYADQHAINSFDITHIEKEVDAKSTTKSIGIETIKLMQKNLYFKPIKSVDKLVVLGDAQLLTPEAQNALLKVLEEPPAHTYIILGTDTKEALLPTILSRCQIIELKTEGKKISEKTRDELTLFIASLPELTIGGRLKQAEQLAKDKEKAINWIESLILILREQLLDSYKQTEIPSHTTFNFQLSTLNSFQSLYTVLKTTNVNPRFAIEHTLLSL
jgi:DNA polymerase III delta prime subunit